MEEEPVNTLSVDRDVVELFKTQFLIEKELRRISTYRLPKVQRSVPPLKLVDRLRTIGILAPRFAALTKKLLSLAPRPAAKTPLTADAVRYINNVGPDAITVLRSMPTRRVTTL